MRFLTAVIIVFSWTMLVIFFTGGHWVYAVLAFIGLVLFAYFYLRYLTGNNRKT